MSLQLDAIGQRIVRCRRCPELREDCAAVAREKRAAFRDQEYWGKPVPGFGDPRARIWIVGLAPAAHGGNRTGRVFTGDRSGDFLYAALHRCGLANQPTSVSRDDGLALRGVWISASCRCAPPANKPTREQLANCAPWLAEEERALPDVRVLVCLGAIAWNAVLAKVCLRPRFAHGARHELGDRLVLASYHVSQQNTFTGRLTEPMLDAVLSTAIAWKRRV